MESQRPILGQVRKMNSQKVGQQRAACEMGGKAGECGILEAKRRNYFEEEGEKSCVQSCREVR